MYKLVGYSFILPIFEIITRLNYYNKINNAQYLASSPRQQTQARIQSKDLEGPTIFSHHKYNYNIHFILNLKCFLNISIVIFVL